MLRWLALSVSLLLALGASSARAQYIVMPTHIPNGATATATARVGFARPAMAEVSAARAARGLPPFIENRALTRAAQAAARYRAAHLIPGHTANDFAFLPRGATARAAGCAAWEPSMGWGSCCTYEGWRYGGAAWATGRDGRRYMHLFVR